MLEASLVVCLTASLPQAFHAFAVFRRNLLVGVADQALQGGRMLLDAAQRFFEHLLQLRVVRLGGH